jgi:hypothetical protein
MPTFISKANAYSTPVATDVLVTGWLANLKSCISTTYPSATYAGTESFLLYKRTAGDHAGRVNAAYDIPALWGTPYQFRLENGAMNANVDNYIYSVSDDYGATWSCYNFGGQYHTILSYYCEINPYPSDDMSPAHDTSCPDHAGATWGTMTFHGSPPPPTPCSSPYTGDEPSCTPPACPGTSYYSPAPTYPATPTCTASVITNRDIALISLGLASLIGWFFIKQFRYSRRM